MYRLLGLFLLVLVVALQYKLWRGEGSWTDEQALRQQVEEQRSENERLKQRNAALVAEVEDLKNGQDAVEERARSELGMVKPGETFYRVVEPWDPKANVRPEDVPEDAASDASPASTASGDQASGSQSTNAAASGAQAPGSKAADAGAATAPRTQPLGKPALKTPASRK